jgi:hypothetical protein
MNITKDKIPLFLLIKQTFLSFNFLSFYQIFFPEYYNTFFQNAREINLFYKFKLFIYEKISCC